MTEELEAICFPIELPEGTGNDKKCQNFVRSVGSPRLDCNPSPVEQLNQITHWLDASNVYGSSENQSLSLRKLEDGLLKSDFGSNGQEFLPFNTLGSYVGPVQCRGQSKRCALSGDFRTSEQPSLVSMHTLFLREHNRIARSLKQFNPGWGDERIYQESRRILIAEWQHVIYNEWIPVLIGKFF